jgi:hypothetical protein
MHVVLVGDRIASGEQAHCVRVGSVGGPHWLLALFLLLDVPMQKCNGDV